MNFYEFKNGESRILKIYDKC